MCLQTVVYLRINGLETLLCHVPCSPQSSVLICLGLRRQQGGLCFLRAHREIIQEKLGDREQLLLPDHRPLCSTSSRQPLWASLLVFQSLSLLSVGIVIVFCFVLFFQRLLKFVCPLSIARWLCCGWVRDRNLLCRNTLGLQSSPMCEALEAWKVSPN